MNHRISLLGTVLVRVSEHLSKSTSANTSTIIFYITSTSTVRVQEIQYSSTASTSTECEYPSPSICICIVICICICVLHVYETIYANSLPAWYLSSLWSICFTAHPVDCLISEASNGHEYIGTVNKTVDGSDCIQWIHAVSIIAATRHSAWWRHRMETFSALPTLWAGNSPVTGEFSAQRPVTQSFDIFFDLRLNTRLNKQSSGWWFETPSWRHCNDEK